MKKLQKYFVLFPLFALLMLTSATLFANEGELKIKLGGVVVDDQDNLGVNQETFNTYEGFAFSIYDFRYDTDAGFGFNADLKNITLNNRNLRFNAYKPGLFNISVFNNQYRRTYDEKGEKFTRRESSGIKGFIKPSDNIKLFGGFNYNDKNGISSSIYSPVADTIELSTDYSQYSYNFGTNLFSTYGNLSFEYKNIVFQDDLNFSNDREANQYNISISTSFPDYDKLKLFGGYFSREDKLDDYTTKLESSSIWAAAKLYFNQNWKLDYRLVLSNSKHSDVRETDNTRHTFSLSKAWTGYGGLSFGYEMIDSDDTIDKTSSSGLVLRGWYKYQNKVHIKAKYSAANKDVDEGSTIYGKEERSHSNISIKYVANDWSTLKGKIDKRIKEYIELNSKVDYTQASGSIYLKKKDLGKLSFTAAYYLGEFKNQSTNVNYEFSDHVLSANISPELNDKFEVWTGATYYRSRRDIDLEKFNFNFGISWKFIPEHQVALKYKAYTFDDLLIINNTYTANIIEISLIKDLKL